jgi:hypothetical protein
MTTGTCGPRAPALVGQAFGAKGNVLWLFAA